jgi:hypothetical protein
MQSDQFSMFTTHLIKFCKTFIEVTLNQQLQGQGQERIVYLCSSVATSTACSCWILGRLDWLLPLLKYVCSNSEINAQHLDKKWSRVHQMSNIKRKYIYTIKHFQLDYFWQDPYMYYPFVLLLIKFGLVERLHQHKLDGQNVELPKNLFPAVSRVTPYLQSGRHHGIHAEHMCSM